MPEKHTKKSSPWMNAKKALQKQLECCTWCNGKIKKMRLDYWECIKCGKYHEMQKM